MSRTFQTAVGGLLLLLAGLLAFMFVVADAGPRVGRGLAVAEGLAVVGIVFLVQGLRSPFSPAQRTALRRRLALGNLVVGPILFAASAGLLYLKFEVINVLPDSLTIPALLGLPIGVFVTASLFRLVCARCGSRLASARATAAQLGRWAPAAGPLARGAAWIEHCPRCRGVAVLGPENARVVLRDAEARQLVGRILDGAAALPAEDAPPPVHAALDAPRIPNRPLRIEPGFAFRKLWTAALVSIACLAFGAAFGVESVRRTRGWLEDLRVAAAGTPAAASSVELKEKVDKAFGVGVVPLYGYELRLRWRDAEGRDRAAEQRIVSYFERVEPGDRPVVLVDPTDPGRAVVSSVTRLRYGPFVAMGWWGVVAIALAITGLRIWLEARRVVRATRACADRGAEVQFPVLSLEEAKNGLGARVGRWHLTVGLPGRPRDAKGAGRTATLPAPPILVGTSADRRAIGLVADGRLDEAVFPVEDLRPFLAPEPEKATWARRTVERGGA
jgi:hypothetical protein